MTINDNPNAAQAASPEAKGGKAQTRDPGTEEKLMDPQIYEDYEQAMGELSDADSAASLGGPAA